MSFIYILLHVTYTAGCSGTEEFLKYMYIFKHLSFVVTQIEHRVCLNHKQIDHKIELNKSKLPCFKTTTVVVRCQQWEGPSKETLRFLLTRVYK